MAYRNPSELYQTVASNLRPISSTLNVVMIGSIACTLRNTSSSSCSQNGERSAEIMFAKRCIETGKEFKLEEIKNQRWHITPFLGRKKWENIVQMEERVYPLLIRECYDNAHLDESKTLFIIRVGGKEIYLSEELIAEVLELPINDSKILQDHWFRNMQSISLPFIILAHIKNIIEPFGIKNCLPYGMALTNIFKHAEIDLRPLKPSFDTQILKQMELELYPTNEKKYLS